MTGTDGFDTVHGFEHRVTRLLIDIARMFGRALGEYAARIGGGVQDGDTLLDGQVDHRVGVAVDQREPVVGDQSVEVPVLEDRDHDVGPPGRKTNGIGKSFFLHFEELGDGAIRGGHLIERSGVFGVVDVEQVDAVEVQRLQAFFERLARSGCVELACFHVAIELRRDDNTIGQSASFADDLTDSGFTSSRAIVSGGVEELRRSIEDRFDSCLRARLVDRVSVGVRHVAERAGAEAERGYGYVRSAKLLFLLQSVFSHAHDSFVSICCRRLKRLTCPSQCRGSR